MIKFDKETLGTLKGVILLLIVLVLVILLSSLFIKNKITGLEKALLTEQTEKAMLYVDSIDINDTQTDSYILYALEYSYNENDKDTLTYKEIQTIIKNIFDKDLSEDSLNAVGITPLLLDNNVIHKMEEKSYSINKKNMTQRQIANIPINIYKQTKVKKKRSKYIVEYEKITIENPYDILNYYNDLSASQPDQEPYDTTAIMNYLTAKGKMKDIKSVVNDKIIEQYGKVYDKKIIVTCELEGTKFIIEDIKEK